MDFENKLEKRIDKPIDFDLQSQKLDELQQMAMDVMDEI